MFTVLLVSCLYFGANLEKARGYFRSHSIFSPMLEKSRFNRRLHQQGLLLVEATVEAAGTGFRPTQHLVYLPPGLLPGEGLPQHPHLPVPACPGEAYRGRCVARREYFYGVKVCLVLTEAGLPVEVEFLHGSVHDSRFLQALPLDFAPGNQVYADSAFTNYLLEDLQEGEQIGWRVQRKGNSKRKDEPWVAFLKEYRRKAAETEFSQLTALMPTTIHTVTFQGFQIKLLAFILAFGLDKFLESHN